MSCKHYSGTTAVVCEKCAAENVANYINALLQRNKELESALREINRIYTPNGNLARDIEQALKGAK